MLLKTKLAQWLGLAAKPRRRTARQSLFGLLERLEDRRLLAAEIFVATAGDDWANGSVDHPFQTIRRAMDAAQAGDVITLRNGVYEGGINIDIDNLTIRSMPGEWAVVESPLSQWNDGHANSVFRYGYDVQGGRLENLEITGGYYYGVMFWDWWDSNFEAGSTHVGASGVTLDHVKVHDTGVDGIKITPAANDITIINSEVFNTGRRTKSSADGIDNNNGDRMIARGNYIHDVPGIGILTSGGTEDSLIEQNFIEDTGGAGIVNGFYTEMEWIEPDANPGHFASIDTVVRNNIVVNAGQAGVGIYGALNAQVYNNTLINAADDAQAPIQFGGYDMWVSNTAPSYEHIASVNPSVLNNLIVTNPENLTRMVDIREGSITGPLMLDYNQYYGTSTRGVLFIDRNLTGDGTPEQTLSQWQTNYGYDTHSFIADPRLDSNWHLTASSPAIGQAIALIGLGFQPEFDFDGNPRQAGSLSHDIGADEFKAGANLSLPPAPFGAPSLEIAQRSYHDYEANTINVKVVRQGTASDTVSVQFATLDGSAKNGLDYNSVAGTLTFAPGETEKIIAVQLLRDDTSEGDEHFLFTLSDPTTDGSYPVRLGHQSSASMTVDDEDTPITLHYATKFVSGDGSDANGDGSQANPWHSLQHAADNVGPGDYVIVQPGKYWGFNLTTDGKVDTRITFHAMPGVEIDEAFPGQQDGINLEGADFVTIEGFHVHDIPRAGLRSVNNNGVILRENVTDHNTMWGILTGWSENIIVENNVASQSQVEHGIYISNSADGAIVRNNIVWGNNDSGIQFNADRYLPGDGVHSRNLVEGNVVFENGRGGGAALNFDGFQDSVVQNNLLYNNHATGIVLYVGFAADSSTNNLVTNNTVVMAEDARWALLMTDGSSGNVVTNNILLNKNPSRGSMTVEHNSLPALSDYNIIQDLFQTDGTNGSFASWQSFSGGMDTHSIVADPPGELDSLFVNSAANDYHLKSGSAAIDVGDPTGAPPTDLFGHTRPTGAGVDIGAYEYSELVPAVNVQFEWSNVIGYEFIGMSEVAVTRTGDTEGTLVVDVTSTNGTAGSDDYQPVNEQITFKPGESRKTFRVFVNDDALIEGTETVLLRSHVRQNVGAPSGKNAPLSGESGYDASGDDSATLHIVSDDAWKPGSFQFDSKSITFNETDGTATVTVHRLGGSSGDVSLNFATDLFTAPKQATWIKKHTDLLYPTDRDTPATAGIDYIATHGTLNFADGETTKTITIPLVNDDWYEGGEAFVLKLSEPTNGGTLGAQSEVKVRIESDDVKLPGTFVFANAAYTVVEGTPFVNVTVNRNNGGNVEAAVRLYHTGAGNGLTTGSAWVPSDYSSLPEMLTFAPGEMSKTISIPIIDDSSTEIDEVFSIQLHSPSNDATIGDLAKTFVTIQDNESTFYFRGATASSYSFEAVEGTGKLAVTVVRQGALTTPASVTINTGEWCSATSGVDFTPLSVTLNFAPGESSKTIDVPLINDTLMESKESFYVSMSNAIGAQQGSWSWSSYIIDDDVVATPGKLEFGNAMYSVGEAGGMLNVTVNRVGGSAGTVTVQYRTLDGATDMPTDQKAYAGSDYSAKNGTLSFAPGETSKTINIPITNDTRVEKNEFFTLELRNPAGGATFGTVAKAVVTIVEDDSAIEFGQSAYVVNESAGYVTITIVRKGSTAGAATVDLNLSSGGAAAGQDFIKPTSPTVTFADGESVKTLQIQLIDDVFKETDEWLYLSLTNTAGARAGSSLWGNVKITDND
ncbi:MAG: right-handed parallel beta-helix repeat-containing protein [Planctomycetales bacterium]|nr:right-handed parallel beta-helix repeat-containing protein [Planctomycetales bacterium]